MATIDPSIIDAEQGAAEGFDLAAMVVAASVGESGVGLIVAAVLELIADLLRVAAEIETLINDITGWFSGRNPADVTLQAGENLLSSQNPHVTLIGAELVRNAAQNSLNLADSPAVEQLIRPTITLVEETLNVREIGDFRTLFNNVIFAGQSAHELDAHLGLALHGQPHPPSPLDLMRKGIALEPFPTGAWLASEQFDHGGTTYIPGQGSFPPPINIGPQNGGTHRVPPPPRLPPEIQLPPPPPPGCIDTGGDAFDDLCATIGQNLQYLGKVLQHLQSQGTDAACCDELVAAINAVASAVAAAKTTVNVSPPDLSGIADALKQLAAAIASIPGAAAPVDLSTVTTQLARIADALSTNGTNLQPLIDELKREDDEHLSSKEVLDYLVQTGAIEPQLGQLLGDPIVAMHDPTRHHPEIKKALKFLGEHHGDDANRFVAWVKQIAEDVFAWLKTDGKKFLASFGADPAALDLDPLAVMTTLGKKLEKIAGAPAIAALDFVLAPSKRVRTGALGETSVIAQDTLSRAWALGEAAHILAMIAGVVPDGLGFSFSGFAALVAKGAGFDEIIANIHGIWYELALGVSTRYEAQRLIRPYRPTAQDALELSARRLLSDADTRELMIDAGIRDAELPARLAGRYQPINPRALATAYIDVPFPRAAVQGLLEYGGHRPADIPTLLDAMEAGSIKALRQSYITAILTAAERGDMTDADVDSALDTLNFSDEAKRLAHLTIATRKLQQLNELYRKSVSEGYTFGTVTDADYVANLEAIGIAEADAKAHYAVDSIRKHGKDALAAAHKAALEAAAVKRAAVQAAIAQFHAGTLNDTTFVAGLVAAGVSPAIAAFALSTQLARQVGTKSLVFGLTVPRARAVQLREAVAALKEQVVKKLVTPTDALARLTSFGIPLPNRESLVAQWAAEIKTLLPIS